MRALLDTSSFLWFIGGSEKLSGHANDFISDPDNQLMLSSASLWEIAIKISLGKLELRQSYEQFIPEQLKENDIALLPTELSHFNKLIRLPFYHRDPFDRLIIAQAIAEDLPVITPDAAFAQYQVKLLW